VGFRGGIGRGYGFLGGGGIKGGGGRPFFGERVVGTLFQTGRKKKPGIRVIFGTLGFWKAQKLLKRAFRVRFKLSLGVSLFRSKGPLILT
jgi:hypothetical protein